MASSSKRFFSRVVCLSFSDCIACAIRSKSDVFSPSSSTPLSTKSHTGRASTASAPPPPATLSHSEHLLATECATATMQIVAGRRCSSNSETIASSVREAIALPFFLPVLPFLQNWSITTTSSTKASMHGESWIIWHTFGGLLSGVPGAFPHSVVSGPQHSLAVPPLVAPKRPPVEASPCSSSYCSQTPAAAALPRRALVLARSCK